jgi:putative transcriptional regulator
VKWQLIGPGMWQRRLPVSRGAAASLRLLRIGAGRKMPEHGHGGHEMTLILRGAYEDSLGHFGPGDVADLDVDIEHQPEVVSDEDCICLVSTEAPTRFKGFVSRLMQPFVGL